MSSSGAEADLCCANCGVAEIDDMKLEKCDGCDLVKYCGDKCQENHREQHEEDCKIRAQQLHDKKSFRQPGGSNDGECPLCFIPMPLHPTKCAYYPCCSKIACDGCSYTHYVKHKSDNCPFCREPSWDVEEDEKREMKRVKANDPVAMREMGAERYDEGDYDTAFEYWTKAAELGDADSHFQLSVMYRKGNGVEKDKEKEVYHLEKAAIGGDPVARWNLACIEEENDNMERAVKHFIIAANLGYEDSMKSLWEYYKDGDINKKDLEATLRTHKAAIDAMKSSEREAALAWRQSGGSYESYADKRSKETGTPLPT
jgi:hypothetical protein